MEIKKETIERVISRVWHVGLLLGSAYIAGNPKYAWLIPLLQGVGQVSIPVK